MKYEIEYSGGSTDATWHGTVMVDADDAAQAAERVANDMACIPANVDAINPVDEVVDGIWTGNKKLDELREKASRSSTGVISVTIEDLNQILPIKR